MATKLLLLVASIVCVQGVLIMTDTACNATGNSSFSISRAPHKKPPTQGRPLRINLLHDSQGYGYLGDHCVPGYNLAESTPHSPNNKWRVICRRPSQVFIICMAINTTGEDYLQIRRRAFRGHENQFRAFNMKLDSIVIGHSRDGDIDVVSSFRVAYVCVGQDAVSVAEQIFLNKEVLQYIESQEDGIEKAVSIIKNITEAHAFDDPVVMKILELASFDFYYRK